MWGLSETEQLWIRVTLQIGMGASLLGSVFIIAVFGLFKDLRCYAFRLVVYLATMDTFNALVYFLPDNEEACQAQAMISSFFSLSSVLMTAVLAYTLDTFITKKSADIAEKDMTLLLFSTLPSAIAAALPLITNDYGHANGWCWIESGSRNNLLPIILRFCTFYIPLWIVIVYNSCIYYRVIRRVRNEYDRKLTEESREGEAMMKKLVWYPMVLVASYILITISRLLELINNGESSFYLILFGGLAMSLNGFANAVVYGFTDSVRYRLKVCCFPENRISFNPASTRLRDSELR